MSDALDDDVDLPDSVDELLRDPPRDHLAPAAAQLDPMLVPVGPGAVAEALEDMPIRVGRRLGSHTDRYGLAPVLLLGYALPEYFRPGNVHEDW